MTTVSRADYNEWQGPTADSSCERLIMDAWRGYVRRAAAIGIGVVLLLCGAQAAVSQNTVELEQELAKTRDTIAKQQAELAECRAMIAKLQAEGDARVKLQEQMRAEVDQLRAQARAVLEQRDAAMKTSVAQVDQLQAEMMKLRRELEAAKADRVTKVARPLPREVVETPELPKVEGLVLAVEDGGVVEISLGSDDGLKPGHKLEVVRTTDGQGIYVGRIEIVKVTPDRAVGKSLPDFEKRTIAKGDRVYSKL